MIHILENNYDLAYTKAIRELHQEKYRVSNDEKIVYESSALFEFNKMVNAIEIKGDNFVSKYNYDQFMINGNICVDKELQYFSKCILKNRQLDKLIIAAKKNIHSKQLVIILPKDNFQKMPCEMYIFFRIINSELIFNCHMRANNAYGLSIINIHINNAIIKAIMANLEVSKFRYHHWIDSFHICSRDIENVENILKKINV